MLSCRRFIFSHSHLSLSRMTPSLIMRHNSSSSSSVDLSSILQDHSHYFEQKSSKTIAFETFVQTPAEFVANTLLQIHDSVGLPWWATIALATVTFRAVVGASITISQQRFIERLQFVRKNVTNKLEPRIKVLNIQAMKGKTASIVEEKKNIQREVMKIMQRFFFGNFCS